MVPIASPRMDLKCEANLVYLQKCAGFLRERDCLKMRMIFFDFEPLIFICFVHVRRLLIWPCVLNLNDDLTLSRLMK